MRVLKCYLANDREGHFVTAGEAMSAPGQIPDSPPRPYEPDTAAQAVSSLI